MQLISVLTVNFYICIISDIGSSQWKKIYKKNVYKIVRDFVSTVLLTSFIIESVYCI